VLLICAQFDHSFLFLGGPLYDPSNKLLVGLVSWGYECAMNGYPGVYSRVSSQAEWIKNTVCTEHSHPKPDFCNGVSLSPTPSPVAGQCSDAPKNWHETTSIDYDCGWYANNVNCETYGNKYIGEEGKTANQACCACGGGSTSPASSCQNPRHARFSISVMTYDNVDGVSYKVRMRNNEGKFTKIKVRGNNLNSNGPNVKSKCLPKRKCFRLFMRDIVEGGVRVQGQGSRYMAYWDGKLFKISQFEQRERESVQFGNC